MVNPDTHITINGVQVSRFWLDLAAGRDGKVDFSAGITVITYGDDQWEKGN